MFSVLSYFHQSDNQSELIFKPIELRSKYVCTVLIK